MEEAVRKAMMRHPTDADIAQYGNRTLARLTQDGAEEHAQEVGSGSEFALLLLLA